MASHLFSKHKDKVHLNKGRFLTSIKIKIKIKCYLHIHNRQIECIKKCRRLLEPTKIMLTHSILMAHSQLHQHRQLIRWDLCPIKNKALIFTIILIMTKFLLTKQVWLEAVVQIYLIYTIYLYPIIISNWT